MAARARHEDSQARQEIERLKQERGRAVAKGPLELVHDQAVTIAAQALGRRATGRNPALAAEGHEVLVATALALHALRKPCSSRPQRRYRSNPACTNAGNEVSRSPSVR